MKLQIASDLHIEYKNDNVPEPLDFITPSADILVLAGDIGSFYKFNQLFTFLEKLCTFFKVVLFVPGNHEWYMVPNHEPLSWDALENRMKKIEKSIDNLYVLDRLSVRIGNICIAGATLWTNPKCQVPPFIVRVNGMRTHEYKERHLKDLQYLDEMSQYCKNKELKLVVITHHPPTEKVLDNAKKRKKFVSLYASNLDDMLSIDKVSVWICGHTHKNFDIQDEDKCRIVSNQKGKEKDQVDDFSKKFIIEV